MGEVKIIRKLTIDTSKDGNTYRIGWFVTDGSQTPYLYAFRASADAWTGGSGTYITACKSKRRAQHWLIYAEASDNPYLVMDGNITQDYDSAEVQFYPSWFGLRNASDSDVSARSLNIKGEVCKLNDYICHDATSSHIGTVDSTSSPFTDASMQAAFSNGGYLYSFPVLMVLGHAVSSVIYKVEYPSTIDDVDMELWFGVNGTFGSGAEPRDSTAGVWISFGAHAKRYVQNGTVNKSIVRAMKKAPEITNADSTVVQMLWDPAKNGGTWTW